MTVRDQSLKGWMIAWELNDVAMPKVDLSKLLAGYGYEKLVPRADYKSAMIRALKYLLKGDETFYKRLKDDNPETVIFLLLKPQIEVDGEEINLDLEKQLQVTLYKKTGKLVWNQNVAESPTLRRVVEVIETYYKDNQAVIGRDQFATIMLNVMRDHCAGVAMRRRGGFYYVSLKYEDELKKFRELYEKFGRKADFVQIPLGTDEDTKAAIEHAVHQDISGDIDEMLDELDKSLDQNKLSDKVLANRVKDVRKLLNRVLVHEEDLRSSADSLKDRAKKLQEVLEAKLHAKVEDKPFNLRDALAAMF